MLCNRRILFSKIDYIDYKDLIFKISMKNVLSSSTYITRISLFVFLMSVFFVPLLASASTKTSADATIDVSSLTSNLSKPTITGTATGTKSIKISIYKEGSKKTVYKKSSIKVRDGIWKSKISKKLPNGTYTITISGTSNTTPKILATEILLFLHLVSITQVINVQNLQTH